MKIAILIPAYNAEKYVDDCLASLRAQTHADWVAFVMNDGSKDGTLAAIERIAAEEPRIRVWSQENRGLVAAMNALLEKLDDSIDLVSFVDIDDFIHPQMLETLASALTRHGADVAECQIRSVPEDAHPAETFDAAASGAERVIDDMSVYWLKSTAPKGWINKQNKIYRRSAIGAVRFQPTLSYEDDYFFACEVNAQIRRKVLLDAKLYAYRNNPNSATSSIPFRKYVGATLERIRLSCAVFLNAGRVPSAFETAYRAELAKDAYRMCIRKNLKKNHDGRLRRELFLAAGRFFAELERDYGFSPEGLNPVQKALYAACLSGRYCTAMMLVLLT